MDSRTYAVGDDESDMSSSSQVAESWISAFCSLVGHEYFAEVSEDFIEDDFNLTGLQSQVPMYKEALEMILDVEPEEDMSDEDDDEDDDDDDDDDDDEMRDAAYRRAERRHMRMASDLSVIESSAEMLYGLIHQRYITSRQGIQQMAEKYDMGHFGHCPRVYCGAAKVLPVGCSDTPGTETVKLFCPSCLDVYTPPNSRFQSVDGAFFGTTFGCLFFMTFPELQVAGQKLAWAPLPDAQSPLPDTPAGKRRSSLSSSLTAASTSAPPPPSVQTPPTPPQPPLINGVAPNNLAPGLGPGNIYEPRIYGFRVSEFAKSGPRMKWLRGRPTDVNELDEVAIWDRAHAPTGSSTDVDLLDEEDEVDDEEVDDDDDEDEDPVAESMQFDGAQDSRKKRIAVPPSAKRRTAGVEEGGARVGSAG